MNTKPINSLNSVKHKAAALPTRTIALSLAAALKKLAQTSATARLDGEILLAHVLRKNRAYLRAWPERTLGREERARFHDLIAQRAHGTPIAYLTGRREFWSREFMVTPDVLIPRPETELLIELALSFIPRNKSFTVLDLGTGSGAIAVTLAAERPLARVTATDISEPALQMAQRNAALHRLQNIHFVTSDWFSQLPVRDQFDLIISNPPYIAAGDPHLRQGDVRFEPGIALHSGPSGLDALALIADRARDHLRPGCHLLLEHGFNQAADVKTFLATAGYNRIVHYPDLQGHLRATAATA